MARIAGVNIPVKKHLRIALTYIYGIGITTAEKICQEASVPYNKLPSDLTEGELAAIRKIIEGNYIVEGDLRRKKTRDIERLKRIRCYRGLYHIRELPVRGQRTRTNASTRKKRRVN